MYVVLAVVLSTICSCLMLFFPFVLQFQSIANLDYLQAASPNSYFTGLPLLIQPSELCIIHPQHVVDMKCRNTFSSNINNSCSEKREQNAKWVAYWNVEGNNSVNSVTWYVSSGWRGHFHNVLWPSRMSWLFTVEIWSSRGCCGVFVIIESQRLLHL